MTIYQTNSEKDVLNSFVLMAGIGIENDFLKVFDNINYPVESLGELTPNFAAELLTEILTDSVDDKYFDCVFTIEENTSSQKNLANVRKFDLKNNFQWLES